MICGRLRIRPRRSRKSALASGHPFADPIAQDDFALRIVKRIHQKIISSSSEAARSC